MAYDGINPNQPTPNPTPSSGGGDILGSLVMAGASIYNQYQAAETAKYNTNATIAGNRSAAELAYSRDLEMWHRANQYNSPEAQMARLKAAGLNPNLVYGNGAAGNSAGALPKYNAPQVQYNYKPAFNIPEIIGMYQDFRARQAQVDNIHAQTENVKARTVSEAVRPGLLEMQAQSKQWETTKSMDLMKYQAQILEEQAKQSQTKTSQETQRLSLMKQSEVSNLLAQEYKRKAMTAVDIDNEKRRADLLFSQYRNQWMSMGITSSDNIFFRVMVRMMKESGLDFGQVFK